MAKAIIRKDPEPDPRYCWYYSVDTDAGDPIDYGSLETWGGAMRAVEHVLTHRDQYDNPEEN